MSVFQALDGFGAAVLGLMLALIAADLTKRTGCLKLVIGVFGWASSLEATLCTVLASRFACRFGAQGTFLFLAGAVAAASFVSWLAMSEIRPARRRKARQATLPA